jgi:hypothetical protein
MEHYGLWQLSMNLYNPQPDTLHEVFATAQRIARHEGAHMTGTELIGLIPESCLRYSEAKLTGQPTTQRAYPATIDWLNLTAFRPFDPQVHILEQALGMEPISLSTAS